MIPKDRIINFLLGVCILTVISCTAKQEYKTAIGTQVPIWPETVEISVDKFSQVIFVAKNFGDGDGSKSSPYGSISKAIEDVSEENTAIFVAEGIYTESPLILKDGVHLFGGFDSLDWKRDIMTNITELSGEGENRVLIAAEGSVIDGFTISGGLIRGQGGGIYFKSVSPEITNNVFINNKTLGPENWDPEYWHEMANDGGAIYFEGDASPLIKNNHFITNKTENGRGAGIACNDRCKPVIHNNVFFSNISGLDDPMRSSDGGAISIFDWGNADIRNNVFLSNTADNRNDAGAVFIALWSSAEISNNLFVDSEAGDDAGALFVGGQEHRYDEPLDPIPPDDEFYVAIHDNTFIGNHNSSKNSGAIRFTMESRGEFVKNITALNNGVYFQRSEIAVNNNIILDNFLFLETKEGLGLGSILDNLIWADFDLRTGAEVRGNNMYDLYDASSNYKKKPEFKDDAISITAFSTNWMRGNHYSEIYDPIRKFEENELVNRVIKSGDKYSVVISNSETMIKIWGDFSGRSQFTILPTYKLME